MFNFTDITDPQSLRVVKCPQRSLDQSMRRPIFMCTQIIKKMTSLGNQHHILVGLIVIDLQQYDPDADFDQEDQITWD